MEGPAVARPTRDRLSRDASPALVMLVYNLPATEAIFERFGGVDGSAYLVGGLGMTALVTNDIVVVPIRSGVGLRLGANFGYLKFSRGPTWNPFWVTKRSFCRFGRNILM